MSENESPKSPSTAHVFTPLVTTLIAVLIGGSKCVLPLVALGGAAALIRFLVLRKSIGFGLAMLIAFVIWLTTFFFEQKLNPEITAYRAAGGAVPAAISIVPYIGPVVVLLSEIEQQRRDLDRVINFKSESALTEVLSLDAMGMMLAFCAALLRWQKKPLHTSNQATADTLKTHEPAKSELSQPPAMQPSVEQPISEPMRAWIRQGGLVVPLSIQSRVPPSIATKQDLDQMVADALAEFDLLHPDRRIAEPASSAFDPSSISAPIEVRINLKFSSAADFRTNIDVEKALFDIFERRQLPFKGS